MKKIKIPIMAKCGQNEIKNGFDWNFEEKPIPIMLQFTVH